MRALERERQPLVLAVSGGIDSMVLLECVARSRPAQVAAVATFDHRSGPHARNAARHVARRARELGLPVEGGVARRRGRSEADWRAARWAFLSSVARSNRALVVTAHTRDDQVETVLIRALRGAGARGLAGLYAVRPGVRRPLVDVSRADVHAYANAHDVRWVDDPSNDDRRYRRNRVRHELLPALCAAQPGFDEALLAVARRAAEWRRDVERVVQRFVVTQANALHVAADQLARYDRASLAVLWPALAARAGATLDRRGTERLVGFTISGGVGGRVQLAGGWEVIRRRETFELRRQASPECDAVTELPLAGAMRWGRWSFYPGEPSRQPVGEYWRASLPLDRALAVRGWEPGDRMEGPDGRSRRVKRFLREAGIEGTDRKGWPVVIAGDEIVWIPGVRRSGAATERSGRPGVSCYCELDGRVGAGG